MASMRPDSFFRGRTATSTPLQRSSVGSSGQEETVVVTSREVNSLMDSNASILNKIKDQAKVLDAVTKTQKEILKVIAEINEKIDEFEPPEHEADQDDKLPPLLSSQVHLVYSQLTENEAFKPQESLISAHNASVRQFLEKQISAKEGGFSKRQIKKAVSRYYETKRKQYLQGLPRNQERTERTLEVNKLRSRRKRLYNSRVKVADGEDAESIKSLTYEYVSDEEDGEGDDEGKWVVRPPAWRSREASDLMQRLQAKVDRLNKRPKVFRVRGDNSDRGRPSATTTWAVRRVASTPTKSPGTSRNASTPTSSQVPSRYLKQP